MATLVKSPGALFFLRQFFSIFLTSGKVFYMSTLKLKKFSAPGHKLK